MIESNNSKIKFRLLFALAVAAALAIGGAVGYSFGALLGTGNEEKKTALVATDSLDESYEESDEDRWVEDPLDIDKDASKDEQARQINDEIDDFLARLYEVEVGGYYFDEVNQAFYGYLDLNSDGIAQEEEFAISIQLDYEFLVKPSDDAFYSSADEIRFDAFPSTEYEVVYNGYRDAATE